MKKGSSIWTRIIFVLVCSISLPVWAAAYNGGDVVNFADANILAGETVDSVVVIGGNLTIAGTVQNEVVVIDGNINLQPTAHVGDHVAVIGGHVVKENGAYIGRGVFRLDGERELTHNLVMSGFMLVVYWFIKAAMTVALIFLPVALTWLRPLKSERLSEIIESHILKAVIAGTICCLSALVLILLLARTGSGSLGAIIIALILLLTVVVGLGGVYLAIGRRIPLSLQINDSVIRYTLYGGVLLALLSNLPFIGLLIFIVSCAAGLGAVCISLPRKKV